MLARIRKAAEEKDSGFTLIELLVVIIIIGILAAIAIPVFLNQRKKAVDASMKSDLRTAATEMETQYTDSGDYALGDISAVPFTTGNTVVVTDADTAGFCLDVTTTKDHDKDWHYDSNNGGLLVGVCP